MIEPDYPFWADEIAEPRSDMNIKVAAFTLTQKLYYTHSWSYRGAQYFKRLTSSNGLGNKKSIVLEVKSKLHCSKYLKEHLMVFH